MRCFGDGTALLKKGKVKGGERGERTNRKKLKETSVLHFGLRIRQLMPQKINKYIKERVNRWFKEGRI